MTDAATIAELDGVCLAYHDLGPRDASPVLLVHGFASNAKVNWFLTGWTDDLLAAGRRVIALDNRGHGGSSKFYDPADYGPDIFARDASMLLDHLDVPRADVVGYSMGARIAFSMGVWHGARVRRIVLCGMGANLFGRRGGSDAIAHALETDEPDAIASDGAKLFRRFAERTGSDLRALAACIRPSATVLTPELAARIEARVLVAVGSEDDVAGPPEPLADALQNAEVYVAEGKDHMKATGDPGIKRAVIAFLNR